ncbi:hypothetical protein THAPSDRAFT_268185 [Thalassiosira pseudonana CCMP1335]|uniref:Uncharacterized protein n=1 Tax=Thalassiosira pseudonana TaxID=35128 RepID=B8BTL7_THAPS|nr:hypothetical protein THAPSDRAFT_268185 [Thalassiosira pseudonana CCMP1335]EED94622.1 hypothetical protein THAPSDRAFT_268185 [Thalassiosira pseudonana CCMP1335]
MNTDNSNSYGYSSWAADATTATNVNALHGLNNLNSFFQNNQAVAAPIQWPSCTHCQQIFVTNESLSEHVSACPMNSNTANTGAASMLDSNQLQQYLQMQQAQLNQQFQQQQAGGNPYCIPTLNTATLNAPAMNNYQGLNALQQGIELNESNDASRGDAFENMIDRLPAFRENNTAANYTMGVLKAPPVSDSTDFFPLTMPDDEKWLTPLHVFVRQYCAEVFVATPADVAAPCMGKRNPVMVGQIGIRCPYCSPKNNGMCGTAGTSDWDIARARENGVVYPSIVSRIYNGTINLLQRHLKSCAFVPPEVIAKYDELKSSNARSGASKKYWMESATRMGLIDTPDGIRLNKEVYLQNKQAAKREAGEADSSSPSNPTSVTGANAPPLVLPSDKRYTTAFTFHLMAQMQPCVFTEADRLGRRRNLDVGFAGLACRHCFGGYGNGRFFPSSIKTMSDASKTLDAIYKHVSKCQDCPADIKSGLSNLRDFHDNERSKMPFGNQRAFFTKIWGRLHDNDSVVPTMMPAPAATTSTDEVPALPALAMDAVKEDSKPTTADKLEGQSVDALQKMYAQFNRNNASMNKLVNEAA